MAHITPSTPKNFISTRKQTKTPLVENDFTAPKYTTPNKSCRAAVGAASFSNNTPECFSKVHFETPKVQNHNNSKETFDERNLTVAVRIRPMNGKELSINDGAQDVIEVRDREIIIHSNSSSGNSQMSVKHIFQYDHVFWSCDESSPLYASQEDVFMAIGKPLLNSAFRGYNACLFAYGQTGSGKSFSMMGRNYYEIADIDSEEHSGLTPRFCRDLFERISELKGECTVEVSYFEIYNEKIHDLLVANENNSHNKAPLKVREHPEWGPYVVDLSVHSVKNYKELKSWLLMGNKNRATAATNMNEKSSRSHSIFSIELCLCKNNDNEQRRSKVSLVDLAGSERLIIGSSNSEEKIRQGVSINKSLMTLGKVILALSSSVGGQQQQQFVPYRDSVLTWLLKESLGGNSLTSMLATITPSNRNLEETLATLRYACQARTIRNRARINENAHHDRLIRELKSEVKRLNAIKLNLNSSLITNEMEELKLKLIKAEEKVQNAENCWKQRFMESEQNKLRELIESERRRQQLESQFRILETVEMDDVTNLSPYKTNFLQQVQSVLSKQEQEENAADLLEENLKNYCNLNGYSWNYSMDIFTIIDNENKREISLKLNEINNDGDGKNIAKILEERHWKLQSKKKLNKNEIGKSFKEIYHVLGKLKPNENQNELNLLFAKVNKSLQSFETALLNNLQNSNQKSVTFNL